MKTWGEVLNEEREDLALRLYSRGNDTVDIAQRMGITEPEAVRLLASAREKRAQARGGK